MQAIFSIEALETRFWSLRNDTFLEAWLLLNYYYFELCEGQTCHSFSLLVQPDQDMRTVCQGITLAPDLGFDEPEQLGSHTHAESAGPSALMHKHVASFAREIVTLRPRLGCSVGLWGKQDFGFSPQPSGRKLRDWAPSPHLSVLCLFTWVHLTLGTSFALVSSHNFTPGQFIASPASKHLLHTCPPQVAVRPLRSSLSSLPLRVSRPPRPPTDNRHPCLSTDSNQSSRAKRQKPSRTCPSFQISYQKLKRASIKPNSLPSPTDGPLCGLHLKDHYAGSALLLGSFGVHPEPQFPCPRKTRCQILSIPRPRCLPSHLLLSLSLALVSPARLPPALSHPPGGQQDRFLNTGWISNTCHRSCQQTQPPPSVMTFYFCFPSFLLSLS